SLSLFPASLFVHWSLGDQDATAKDQHDLTALVARAGFDINEAAVGFALRFAFIEHFRLGVDCVAMKCRRQMPDVFIFEVGDAFSADIRDRHPNRQTENERSVD